MVPARMALLRTPGVFVADQFQTSAPKTHSVAENTIREQGTATSTLSANHWE